MAVARNLLIVEGKDDLHVMLALRDKLGLKERYEIRDKDNDDQLLKSISTEAKTSGRKALGIVIDRDTDDPDKNKDRWVQIREVLTPMGYDITTLAVPEGAILPSPALGLAKVGIWLMPDNQSYGMLEDFMRTLIPADDGCLLFAEETLEELEKRGVHRYKAVHRAKALMHTWIAWQDKPGIPLGQSATRYLNVNTPVCQQFTQWLNRLFNA